MTTIRIAGKALPNLLPVAACCGLAALSSVAIAQQDAAVMPWGQRVYSPYVGQTFPNQVFFGDTHVHTSYSTDAGMIGDTLGPEQAYRFARGETVTSSTGQPVKLVRPLDFLVVSDHAESLGAAPAIAKSDPVVLETEFGRKLHALIKAGNPSAAYDLWAKAGQAGTNSLAGEERLIRPAWQHITKVAEQFNQPGRFTAFIGFEWTSNPNGNNLHRNVIFRDGKDKADQIIPISRDDTSDPEKLWDWMEAYEQKTGGKLLAIPHNGNLSNGLMFDDVTLISRKPLDRDYAERRARWEPLYEVTQIKGDGEAHPALSTRDEFADFETWDKASFGPVPKARSMLPREYAREAYKRGLAYEAKLGVNPFKFGLIGSSDAHTSLATTREESFFGKVVPLEPSADPVRFDEVIAGRPAPKGSQLYARQTSASGLAAVWARNNSREALWDAMARKETYATTGTRLRVRLFAGWDFTAADLNRPDFAAHGYAHGVAMGGNLANASAGQGPTFMVQALRDPDGANLDRVQIIKGWLDADGQPQEKVYEVVWADAERRRLDAEGKLQAVGNTVNLEQASYSNTIGAPTLQGYWRDPAFDPAQRAFYYVRVLEIPTPRWSTIDAKFFGVQRPEDVPASIQERAYTSPVWYSPAD